MNRFVLLLLAVVVTASIYAQNNLAPNPSFEDKSCCPTTFNGHFDTQIECLNDWDIPPRPLGCLLSRIGSSDHYHTCGINENPLGPRTGNGYAGFILRKNTSEIDDYREYITAELTQPLIKGIRYNVEFFVAAAHSRHQVDQIGAFFSKNKTRKCGDEVINKTPQIENTSGIMFASSGWIKVSGTFIAQDDYEWITIGNFKDNDNTNSEGTALTSRAYYYIDDVSVTADCCPEFRLYEATSSLPELTQVRRFIKAGEDVGIPGISGPVKVLSGQKVTFKAEDFIFLGPGFTAEPGSDFTATIEECSPVDFPPPKVIFFPNSFDKTCDIDGYCFRVENVEYFDVEVLKSTIPRQRVHQTGRVSSPTGELCLSIFDLPLVQVHTNWALLYTFYNCEGDVVTNRDKPIGSDNVSIVNCISCVCKQSAMNDDEFPEIKIENNNTTFIDKIISNDSAFFIGEDVSIEPNPIQNTGIINFSVLEDNKVTIHIKNLLGQNIYTPVNNKLYHPGFYRTAIDFSEFRAGIYFITLQSGSTFIIHKFVKVK